MSDPVETRWRELCWRRQLSAGELRDLRAWLQTRPGLRAEFESEIALQKALGTLSNVPVATNFTARLLEAARREAGQAERLEASKRFGWLGNIPAWLPRLGFGAVIVVAGLFSYQQFESGEQKRMLDSVAAVSEVSTLPTPEILQDFDAIRAMSRSSGPDEELLALNLAK